MRIIAISAAALLAGLATSAAAAPASVQVTVGPELQKQAQKSYGVRDVNDLAKDLQRVVERVAAKTDAYDGARIELVLVDAQPNRPTFQQLGQKVGLSPQSVSIGGAEIQGKVIAADGAVKPVSYKWYETDIRWSARQSTWGDAEDTFGRFAYQLSHDRQLARR